MTSKEAINMLYGIRADNLNLDDAYTKDKYEAITMAIKALEQQPCEDCVSREAVRNALLYKGQISKRYKLGEIWELNLMEIEEAIKELPSVIPQAKTGHWIDKKCSVCGCGSMLGLCIENFCANCGAKMLEPQESEE